jgi:hypothetical protein
MYIWYVTDVDILPYTFDQTLRSLTLIKPRMLGQFGTERVVMK